MPKPSACIVLVTCPTKKCARELSRHAVQPKHAACSFILGPGEAVFEWKGSVQKTEEWILILKTATKRAGTLIKTLAKLHPYECPCILTIPVTGGHAPYLAWISASVR